MSVHTSLASDRQRYYLRDMLEEISWARALGVRPVCWVAERPDLRRLEDGPPEEL